MDMSDARTWDMGDPEPADDETPGGVETVDMADEECLPIRFGRTYDGAWKGYIFGGKVYYSWDELTRRFGPLRAVKRP